MHSARLSIANEVTAAIIGPAVALAAEREVTVLTPRPTVDILRAEYSPGLHATSGAR